MTTPISICSQALLMLGKEPIADFDEGSDRAKYCANLYPALRDQLLRKHFWNCAIKRVLLSPMSTAPAFGFSAQFQLPGDFLRVYEVGMPGQTVAEFQIEGRAILANAQALPLRYVWRADEAQWDAALVHVATVMMAALLAYPVTQSTSLRDSMQSEAARALREAKSTDAQENPSETMGDDFPLIVGRY
jgi:hypothetical protein